MGMKPQQRRNRPYIPDDFFYLSGPEIIILTFSVTSVLGWGMWSANRRIGLVPKQMCLLLPDLWYNSIKKIRRLSEESGLSDILSG